MTPDRFAAASTFEQFVDSAVQLKELWDNALKRTEVSAEAVQAVRALGGTWRMIGLTEDWCLDAVSTLTPVAKLATMTNNVELRVLGRDANLDIMDAHLTNGGRSIPIIILYDENWAERAWWGPRPAELQAWVTTVGKTVESAEKYRHIRGWYARDKGVTAVKEVLDMLTATVRGETAQSRSVHISGQ